MSEAVRAEVVQAIFKSVMNQDPLALRGLTSVTPAERAAADDLLLAAFVASSDHRAQTAEMWTVLIKRQHASPPSWDTLWNELDTSDLERLRELYTALPDPLRRRLDEHDKGTS